VNVLIVLSLTLVAIAGTVVVTTHAPARQAVTLSFFGLTLTVLFATLSAPDVALSQLGVGTAVVPLMVMLAIRTVRGHRDQEKRERRSEGGQGDGR
jgi:energy-converting hydrogenase B subunit D